MASTTDNNTTMAKPPTNPALDEQESNHEAPAEEQGEMSKVPISEEFQQRTMDHLGGANEDELAFVHDQVMKHQEKMREKKEKKRKLHNTDDLIGEYNAVKHPVD